MLALRTPPWCAWSRLLYSVVSNSGYSRIGRLFHRRWIGRNSKGSGGDRPGTFPKDVFVATKYHRVVDDWAEIQSQHLEYSSRAQEIRLGHFDTSYRSCSNLKTFYHSCRTYGIGPKYKIERCFRTDVEGMSCGQI